MSAQLFSLISPAITGTVAMTGAIWLAQHALVTQALKLWECQEAARSWPGSAGSHFSH